MRLFGDLIVRLINGVALTSSGGGNNYLSDDGTYKTSTKEHLHIYFAANNSTVTTISAINTPVKISGTTTSGFGTSGFSMSAVNRIENISGATKRVRITIRASVIKETGGTPVDITLYIAQIGSVLTGSKQTTRATTAQYGYLSCDWVGEVGNGQYFEAYIENNASVDNLIVKDLSVTVVEL